MLALGLLAVLGVVLAGCADDGGAPPDALRFPATTDEMPDRLRSWGLYPDAPRLDRTLPEMTRYEPRFPLWTNGSRKYRDIALPPGTLHPEGDALDGGDFPAGTLFFKTFAFDDPDVPGGVRPVETRVMLRLDDGRWDYASYLWNDAGTDGTRRSLDAETPVEVRAPDGTRFTHVVPARADCQSCHERTAGVVLGYDRLQLGETPLPEAVRAADELTRAVVGYAVGNCASCHNDETPDSFFDLRPAAFVGNVVSQETTTGRLAGAGVRVVPGDPDESFLWLALAGGDLDRAVPAMPPLGAQRIDQDAVDLFRRWIDALE